MCRWFDSCLRHLDIGKVYILFCASGSVVERRLAKAKVAGSIPVSRFFYLSAEARKIRVSAVFLLVFKLQIWDELG